MKAIHVLLAGVALVLQRSRSDDLCDICGADFQYSEALELAGIGRRQISVTLCPNHFSECQKSFCSGGSTEAAPTSRQFNIPLYPVIATSETDVSCDPGTLAVAFNGVPIFGPGDGTPDCNDAVAFEGATFDQCGGHSAPGGNYHYHLPPTCLISQLSAPSGDPDHSPQVGWSLDGFPMYAGEGPGGVSMLQCGESGADSTYCLDDCGGYEGEIDADDFKYRYYMPGPQGSQVCSSTVTNSDSGTCDSGATTPCCIDVLPDTSYYPYTIGCYKGCLSSELSGGTCSSSEDGYTSAYTPAAVDPGISVYTLASSPSTDCSAVGSPSSQPMPSPSIPPTSTPTRGPTRSPTRPPTHEPTTAAPSQEPFPAPTRNPASPPTTPPPSAQPTLEPTLEPSPHPTAAPTPSPTHVPTAFDNSSSAKTSGGDEDDGTIVPFVDRSLLSGAKLIWTCLALALVLLLCVGLCRLCLKGRAREARKELDRSIPTWWVNDDDPVRPSSTVHWQSNAFADGARGGFGGGGRRGKL